MFSESFFFKSLLELQSYILIILALGLLGSRYFFSNFMKQNESYRHSYVLFLMLFTVFASELILAFIGIYFLKNEDIYVQLAPNQVIYFYLLPQFIFFASLCYFLYWIFKLFQRKQNYYLNFKNEYEKTLLEIEKNFNNIKNDKLKQDIVSLIGHKEFKFSYLSEIIFRNNLLLLNNRSKEIPLENGFTLDDSMETINQKFKYKLIKLGDFSILKVNL